MGGRVSGFGFRGPDAWPIASAVGLAAAALLYVLVSLAPAQTAIHPAAGMLDNAMLMVVGPGPVGTVSVEFAADLANPSADWIAYSCYGPGGYVYGVLAPGRHEIVRLPIEVKSKTIAGPAPPAASQPTTRPARGDFDGDGDVDVTDFQAFSACMNGPNRPPACP